MKLWVKIVALVLVLAAVGVFLTPVVMKQVKKNEINGIIEDFDRASEQVHDGSFEEAKEKGEVDDEGYPIDEDGNRTSNERVTYKADLDRLFEDSKKYNESLIAGQDLDEYVFTVPALNLYDYGLFSDLYAYISAPSIDMDIPVYLGASNLNMAYGATHLGGTSLPIGGTPSNCVISGHNGYTGAIYFDNIAYLQVGDRVSITNYWYTINYKVIDVSRISKSTTNDIYVEPGKDRLTLLTCANRGRERTQVICERDSA